jgi:hypothetical protein
MHADKTYPVSKVHAETETHCVLGKSEGGRVWLKHFVSNTVSYYLYNYYIIEYYYYSLLLKMLWKFTMEKKVKANSHQKNI